MGDVQKIEGTKTAVGGAVYSVIDDPRNLDVSIKLNRDASVKEIIREIFKLPKGGEVSPWHVAVFKQINPDLLPEKSDLSSIVKVDSKIRLGDLGYEISKERAEKLLPSYKEALLNPNLKNREEIEKAFSYLEKKIEQKPPEFLLKTSQIEAKVAALFSTKKANQDIGDWIRDIESDRGVKRPSQNLAENIKSLTTALDAYIYSLPEGERHRGAKQAVNLAERISSAYGIELTEWQISRARDWNLKTEDATKRRYLIQLADKLVTEHEVSRGEKDNAEKAAREFANPTKSVPTISTKRAAESFEEFQSRQSAVTDRVSVSWKQSEKYSVENQVTTLESKWKEIEKGATPELKAEFLNAKSELLSLEKSPQAAIAAKIEALQTLIGNVPGIRIENGKVELKTEGISKSESLELYVAITSLSEDKKRTVNQLVSGIVATLLLHTESATNAEKGKTLKQTDVGMQLLLATTHSTPTAQVEYRGYQAKLANLNGKTDESLRLYQETRKYCEGLAAAGVSTIKSTYQVISREEALLISRQEASPANTRRISEIVASVKRDLPRSRAFHAEIKLLEVQAVLQEGDFARGRRMLSAIGEKFNDLPQIVKDVSKLNAEKSDSQLLSGIKTALGSWGKSSMLEAAIYSGGGALLGALMAGPLGAATGAKIGLAIGVLTLAGKNIYEDRHKIYSSYETGLAAVGSAMAITLLASAILDLTGAGKAGSIGLRLTKQLVTEVGSVQVAKALLKGESKEITKKLLRNGLGETAYTAAAEKGDDYLEAKAAEYIRRIFKKAGKAVQDAPLQSSLGSGMFLNQGREIIVQLYSVVSDDTLTPAQKENGYKQVAIQLAELVAFMGTVHTVTRKLDSAAETKISELRETSKSVAQKKSEIVEITQPAPTPTSEPVRPIVGWDEPQVTTTGLNLSRSGFGMSSIFGQRFALSMSEPVDTNGAGPLPPTTRSTPTAIEKAKLIAGVRNKIFGLLSPDKDSSLIRSLERDYKTLDTFIRTSTAPELLESAARKVLSSFISRAPSKIGELQAIRELRGDVLPQIISEMLRSPDVEHVEILRAMPPVMALQTVAVARQRGFLENPRGQIILASTADAPPETFITAASNAFLQGDKQLLRIAYNLMPPESRAEHTRSLMDQISQQEKGPQRIASINLLGHIISTDELIGLKTSLENISEQAALSPQQEVQLLTYILFQRKLAEGDFSGGVFRKLLKANLLLEEKEAGIHSILGFDPEGLEIIDRHTMLSDRITQAPDASAGAHVGGNLRDWLMDLKDPAKIVQLEFVADIMTGVPDSITKLRLFDSLKQIADHPEARSLWSKNYSKIPASSFLRCAEILDWNSSALTRLNQICSKFSGSAEALEFVQSSEALYDFAPEYKKLAAERLASLNGEESPRDVLNYLRSLNCLKNANPDNPFVQFREQIYDYDAGLLDDNPIYDVADGLLEMPLYKLETRIAQALERSKGLSLVEVNKRLDALVDEKIQFFLPRLASDKIADFRAYWDDVSVPLTYLARYPENAYIQSLLTDDKFSASRTDEAFIRENLRVTLIENPGRVSNKSRKPSPPPRDLMAGVTEWIKNRGEHREKLLLAPEGATLSLDGQAKSLASALVSDGHHRSSTDGAAASFTVGYETIKPLLEQIQKGSANKDFATVKEALSQKIDDLEAPVAAFNSTLKADAALRVLKVENVNSIPPRKLEGTVKLYQELGGTDAQLANLNSSNLTAESVGRMIKFLEDKRLEDQTVLISALTNYSLSDNAQGIKQLVAIRKELGAANSLVNLLENLSSADPLPEQIGRAKQEIGQLKSYFAKTEFRRDVEKLGQTIDNIAAATSAPRNVVTFFTDDKRMMMQIGKYPAGTCQHYETGSMARALPAYVGDWFIKGVFVIDVEKAGFTESQIAQLKQGKIPDGVKYDALLKNTIARSVLKYGVADISTAQPGVFIEKPYSLLGDNADKVFADIIAEDVLNWFGKTKLKVIEAGDGETKMLVPGSKNPYGQYEDADVDGGAPEGKILEGKYSVYGVERTKK